MLCKDCEFFEIIDYPQIIGGECWDWGQAHCKKYDLVTDFRSESKFTWLSCVEGGKEDGAENDNNVSNVIPGSK